MTNDECILIYKCLKFIIHHLLKALFIQNYKLE